MAKNKTMNHKSATNWKKGVTIFLFLLPALLLFISVLIAPIAVSIYRSLQDWNGFSEGTFIGLKNYKELFTNGSIKFMVALKNSMILAFFSVFVQLPLSLLLALLLGRKIKGERFFLSVYFMPVLISTVVIGQLWLKIYNPDYGLLNRMLDALNLSSWKHVWVGEVGYEQARAAVGICTAFEDIDLVFFFLAVDFALCYLPVT